MRCIVLLMAVLPTIAPHTTLTVADIEPSTPAGPPTVFRRVTPTPRRVHKGKADSPMLNYIFDSYATSNKHFHDMFRPPAFEGELTTQDTIIDADTGANVVFDCKVTALRDKTVSWLRVSEDDNLELLTVDLDTHTADARYRVDLAGENWKLALTDARVLDSGVYCCHVSTHPPMLRRFKLTVHREYMNWKLALTDARVLDSGVYCCHVSTHPPMLRRFKLTVHPPTIKMSNEAFLETGETLSLKCAVLNLHPGDAEPVLRWYRGGSSTALDELRGGVLVETDHLTLTSHLQVARLKMEDAGNYTCSLEAPISMRAVARVHVLQGSSLAELQSGVKTTSSYLSLLLSSLLLVLGSWCGDVR